MTSRATLVTSYGRSFNCGQWLVSSMVAVITAIIIQTCVTSIEAQELNHTQMSIDQTIMHALKSSNVSGLFNDPSIVRVELDMLFSAEDWLAMRRESDSGARRKRRKAMRNQTLRWPNAEVPYTIMATFASWHMTVLQQAMADYHTYTCVRFRETRPGDQDYLRIVDTRGCASFVGRRGGMQDLSLSTTCRQKGVIIHELGHAIGFVHEHTRPDRDQYVQINNSNILPGYQGDFEKYSSIYVDYGLTPYDYLSVMHYGEYTASSNGNTVIETSDRKYQKLIGQRSGLSFRDVKLVNSIYRCSEKLRRCRKKMCPGEGFVGQDCKCWCPSGNIEIAAVHCSECLDYRVHCPIFQQRGYCMKRLFKDYMKEMCPRSCGYCS